GFRPWRDRSTGLAAPCGAEPCGASAWLLVPSAEVRRLVVLTRAALDLFFFRQQALELGIGLTEQRLRGRGVVVAAVLGGRGLGRSGRAVAVLGLPAATATGADDPALPRLTRGLADRHRGFARDLVFGCTLVGKDLALVDPHLHADAAERGAR